MVNWFKSPEPPQPDPPSPPAEVRSVPDNHPWSEGIKDAFETLNDLGGSIVENIRERDDANYSNELETYISNTKEEQS